VLGGSQGAQFLNTAVARGLADFVARHPDVTIVHQAGEGRSAEAEAAYAGAARVEVLEYVEDMAGQLASASLVVGRAGATTIAELTAVGVPAILVPFPFATDNHQLANAREMERAGGCKVLEQASFNEERLLDELERLHRDRAVLAAMEAASAGMSTNDAAARVLEVARGNA
jgi:UDP-N-acetylglucosamine--N-acetylmuramyl-(pentapeptide) pyrophosphoryl-undecaprenol N-acetylglucosamine transferase